MKSHTEYLVFETRKRREMVHITGRTDCSEERGEGRSVLRFAHAHNRSSVCE
jgi:hypothetical protein